MALPCKNCIHGVSWHKMREHYFDNYNLYWRFHDVERACTAEGCPCRQYEGLKPEVAELTEKTVFYSPEQIALNEKLKASREGAIKIDHEFHELFCKVLKEETNRECDCEGTTSEIRAKK